MKKAFYLSVALLTPVLLFAGGCATPRVVTEYDLPTQAVNAKPAEGLSKVVFFNTSNKVIYGLDKSGVISIKLNGKGLATLNIGQYVQIFLEEGEYALHLTHKDIMSFKSKHSLKVDRDELYVRVFAKPVSTNFKVVDKPGADFTLKYNPAYILKKDSN